MAKKNNGIDDILGNGVIKPSNIDELNEALSDEKYEVSNEDLMLIIESQKQIIAMLMETKDGIAHDFCKLRNMVIDRRKKEEKRIITFD